MGPCEPFSGRPPVTSVQAGDKLKVGWTSNNHGGGFVRLALVPESQQANADAYKRNVLKAACYGHDTRPGKTRYGDCIHPCNGRPGCEWQTTEADRERFDTTITIPTNLENGRYILQWVGIVGNAQSPYYSCAVLDIRGGNTGLTCNRSGRAAAPPCFVSAGPPADLLLGGTDLGDFCYASNGLGNIDDNMSKRPINAACDPRTSCSLSVNGALCASELRGISNPNDPFQTTCDALPPPPPPSTTTTRVTTTTTRTTVISTSTTTTVRSTTVRPTTTVTTSVRPTVTTTTTAATSSPTTSVRTRRTRRTRTTRPTSTQGTNVPAPTGTISNGDSCSVNGQWACTGTDIARCNWDKWVVFQCAAGTQCKEFSKDYFICA